MSRRRRLVTPLGVALVVLAVAGLIGWGLTRGSSMFSPGSLNAQAKTQTLGGVTSHAALADDCTACHAIPVSAGTMASRCLGCHEDVQQQISSGTDLHGKLVAAGWSGTSCGGCHPEHRGATAALTAVDRSFPHDIVGFSLRAHSGETSCQDCHPADFMTFDTATCAACHEQMDQAFMTQHTATFGRECVPCHDGVDRYGENFDHNKLAFPLTAGHAEVECGSCHTGAASVEALQNTPQDCYSCHAKDDAHGGKYGTDCGSCHTPNGWSEVTFDHSKTSFPLVGAHAGIACDKCHVGGKFSGTTADCVSCHTEPAFHAGAFGSQSTQCASCHTATAWTPAKSDFDHSVFPLDHGSQEQAATCKTCHPTTVTAYTCLGCHAHSADNVVAQHEGASLAELQDCIRCHPGGRAGD